MRRLPPFAALRAFEAAARHLSFKAAADELALTPTAISHQVRALEEELGQPLFIRRVRSVTLTAAGRQLADGLGPPLEAIGAAVERVRREPRRKLVTLGAGPILASRWLVPRLGAFWAQHPDIDLRLHQSPVPVAAQFSQVDIAVAWGDGGWPKMAVELLLRIEVTPVLARAGRLARARLTRPAQLLDLPLLHHRSTAGWQQWFDAAGVPTSKGLPGTFLDDANVLLQAVLAGQGVGLGIVDFIADELASGRLLRPFALAVDPGDAYWIVASERSLQNEAVRRVQTWLSAARE